LPAVTLTFVGAEGLVLTAIGAGFATTAVAGGCAVFCAVVAGVGAAGFTAGAGAGAGAGFATTAVGFAVTEELF
jgi:hypothetical protein